MDNGSLRKILHKSEGTALPRMHLAPRDEGQCRRGRAGRERQNGMSDSSGIVAACLISRERPAPQYMRASPLSRCSLLR